MGICIWECTDEDQWELIDGYDDRKDSGMKTTDELFDIYLESWKEHLEGLQVPVNNAGLSPLSPLSKEVEEILKGPIRNPCKYCGEKHLDYACDAQIESIKKQYNIN